MEEIRALARISEQLMRRRLTVRRHIALLIVVVMASAGCASVPGTFVAATPWGIGGVHSFQVQPEPVKRDLAAEAALHKRLQDERVDEAAVVASR
jgi:hypothetical protein